MKLEDYERLNPPQEAQLEIAKLVNEFGHDFFPVLELHSQADKIHQDITDFCQQKIASRHMTNLGPGNQIIVSMSSRYMFAQNGFQTKTVFRNTCELRKITMGFADKIIELQKYASVTLSLIFKGTVSNIELLSMQIFTLNRENSLARQESMKNICADIYAQWRI